MADLLLQGLLEFAVLPAEWLWRRVRLVARRRSRKARALVYVLGATAIALTYLAALAVVVAAVYAVTYVAI